MRIPLSYLLCGFLLWQPVFLFGQADTIGLNRSAEQKETRIFLGLGADFVSQYVWRGQLLDRNPQLQPVAELAAGSFILGVCGSQSLGSSFAEIDLYASYTIKYVTVAIFDYYYMDMDHMSESPFNLYKNTDSTLSPHTLDANLVLNDLLIPNLSITASVFFAGNDHDQDRKRQYSNYLMLDYSTQLASNEVIFSLGGTFAKSFYSSKAAITNISLKTIREINLISDFVFSISGNLAYNPFNNQLFFIFGIKI